jgi:hypothetical protein
MVRRTRARITPFACGLVVAPVRPLKGGFLNERQERLGHQQLERRGDRFLESLAARRESRDVRDDEGGVDVTPLATAPLTVALARARS